MNSQKTNLLLLGGIIVLITALVIINKESSESLDYYKLSEKYYLHKIDYFSSYSIAKLENGNYEDVLKDIQGVAFINDSIFIRSNQQNKIQYFLLQTRTVNPEIFINLDSLDISLSKYTFLKPWQYVEQTTIKSRYLLLSQLTIITIILITVLLVMRVFKLNRLQ